MNRFLLVCTSVRDTPNFGRYAANFRSHNHDPDILIIDESSLNRNAIREQLKGFNVTFYGASERAGWFNSRNLQKYKQVLPLKAHNESSFGLLYAFTQEEPYSMIVFVDDDTYPYTEEEDFLGVHWQNLNVLHSVRSTVNGYYVNTHPRFEARGVPYNQRRLKTVSGAHNYFKSTVLNMGCWNGIPDLNAMDYLAFQPYPEKLLFANFAVAKNCYLPICSMNVAFKPQIIPAYYQLWHRDRYDDIFSGLFIKKIADHLGFGVNVGSPVVYHDKFTRNLFKDVAVELEPVQLNEHLYAELSKMQLTASSWHTCYKELTSLIRCRAKHLNPNYIRQMTAKMALWSSLLEELN